MYVAWKLLPAGGIMIAHVSSAPDQSALQAERRALLDRVQRLSAAEAEASARAERLAMENDALAQELAHSQEVCREMLAARRAARDALADVSAHNCRLLAAYVEKKREAAAAAEALVAHQRESEVGAAPLWKLGCWTACCTSLGEEQSAGLGRAGDSAAPWACSFIVAALLPHALRRLASAA